MVLFRSRQQRSSDAVAVAGVAARLAVFMGAGLPPKRAWQELAHLEEESEDGDFFREVDTRTVAGEPLEEALSEVTADREEAWRVLSAVHQVAHHTGAPLSDALWALSLALRDRHDAERHVRSTILAPLYTKRLLLALPLFGLIVAGILGVNAFGFLTGAALGWLSLVMAGVMVFAAERWSSAMVRDATPGPGYLSPACDLLAIATSGGASPEVAKARVEEALIRHELPEPEEGTLQRLTELSRRVGVPLRQLAKAEAEWSRAKARALAADKTAALSVKILVPLGSLVLPAFVLVAVVPVVFSLLEGAFAPGGSSLW